MRVKLIRRPITFRFKAEEAGSLTCRNGYVGRQRASFYLLWHGVWPQEVARIVQLMRAGTISAAEEVWMHCEHRDVTVEFALGGRL